MAVSPKLPVWLALVGASSIFGGETLCLVGPMRYERIIHITCHAILYAGAVSVALAAAVHWTGRQRQ